MDHINFPALSLPSLMPHTCLAASLVLCLSIYSLPLHLCMAPWLSSLLSLFVRQTGFFFPYKSSLSWIALALAGFVLHALYVYSFYPKG